MTGFLHDLRYSFRTVRKSPGFFVAGILALSFGVGVNSMVFTLLNAVTLRPLPVPHASEVVTLYQTMSGARERHVHGTRNYLSFPEYAAYREQNHVLKGLAAYASANLTLSGADARRITGQLATCNYFSVLTESMPLGRGFLDEECSAPGAHPVVVLSHALWQRQFAGDRAVLGQTIILNGGGYTVIGIAPDGFRGATIEPVQVWAPLSMQEQWIPNRKFLDDANLSWLQVAGRLKEDVSLKQVRADLAVIAARLDGQYPGRKTILSIEPATLMNVPQQRGQILTVGAVVLAAVSLVLLVACANLANMLLARAAGRRKEIAVRLAVGASRRRLVQQLLTESMLVSFIAGSLGMLLAWRGLHVVFPLIVARLPEEASALYLNLTPDVRIVLYSLLLCIVTGVAFGLLPALQASRVDLNTALKEGAGALTGARSWFRSALVATQVAVCLVLLIASGLLVRGLHEAQTIDPGIQMRDIAVATLDLTRQGYDEARAADFHRRLNERLALQLGAEEVALADVIPLSGARRGFGIRIPDREDLLLINNASVSPTYFDLLGIPIVQGRSFESRDVGNGSAPVAIVSESTARKFWPRENAIDKHFRMDGADRDFTVVGVAKDVRASNLSEIDDTYVYFTGGPTFHNDARILARGASGFTAAARLIRNEVRAIDPNVLVEVARMEDGPELFRLPSQITAALGAVLGIAGLLLSALGIYGVVTYTVAQRTREIGIRMSLGANHAALVRMILKQAMRPVAAGVIIGLALSALASRVLSSLLFGVSPLDPIVFSGISLFLVGVALFASYAPAVRAARIDPLKALRME